jgi:glycosyltransferase involved in cell wall biosynthesis
MANQCEQLVRLLRAEGVPAVVVRTNAPCVPAWVGRIRFVRAIARLLPYTVVLWNEIGRAQVVHLLANSGWAWHLLAAPALVIARMRSVPVIVNYRGGAADEFLAGAPRLVRRMLAGAALRVTPSGYILRIFAKYGLDARVIPNIVDLSRFGPSPQRTFGDAPHIVVTRNLEKIYDMPTAIRAFARIRLAYPRARLTIAGTGPELEPLQALVRQFGLEGGVRFPGRIDNEKIPALYASADCFLNPSTVDNMPISILEAMACGVPVVSTGAGGIPDLVEDGVSALLVPVGDDESMAARVLDILGSKERRDALRQAGLAAASRFSWVEVRSQWLAAYRDAAASGGRA